MFVDQTAKQHKAQEDARAKAVRKHQKRREHKCFWTKPLGHKYESEGNPYSECKCVGCGKVAW